MRKQTSGRGRPKSTLRPTSTETAKPKKGAAEKADDALALETAVKGSASTAIKQVLEDRLDPPGADSLKSIPAPGDGESIFVTLHPAYLEKSPLNTFSVDTESENFKELCKSIELVGIKDPVLARFNDKGKLEILSGQRRHLAATTLNRAVPTIIQKIGDADAKILVADGNLHRDKISSYDLSRALRMKMEGMKQKAGRRKKGYAAAELQSDAKLAQEMGMSIPKAIIGPDGKPLTEKKPINPNRFKVVKVFDISQTDGKELPQIGIVCPRYDQHRRCGQCWR